ncbi:hypothetical protein EON67_03165 [archaeon]|nr:MAG: hypothetical protein EON67_03165 [archaeon]
MRVSCRGVACRFAVTGTRMLMVRPTSVALTCHLEHFRQSSARSLASAGSSVKDVDASKPYAAPTLELPSAPLTKQAPNSAKNVKSTTLDGAELNDPLAAPFKPFRLLTGPLGVGKSAVLNHVVAYARRNQWLTVMIPNSWAVMHDGLVLAKSRRRPGMVDQHDIALKLLKVRAELNACATPMRQGGRAELSRTLRWLVCVRECVRARVQETLTTHADILGQIPQRGAYATFRYLPRSIDVKVSAERDRMRAAEEDEKSRLKAQADATGKSWDPSTYKSKYVAHTHTRSHAYVACTSLCRA